MKITEKDMVRAAQLCAKYHPSDEETEHIFTAVIALNTTLEKTVGKLTQRERAMLSEVVSLVFQTSDRN